MNNFIIGLVSGLVTSIIIFLYNILYENGFVPYYTNLIYRGVKLSGTWRGSSKIEGIREIKIVCNISQKAYDIQGTFAAETIYLDRSYPNYSNQYKVSGKIKGNMIVLSYEALDRERTGTGVLMLKVTSGGKNLSGNAMHSEDGDSVAVFDGFLFSRD